MTLTPEVAKGLTDFFEAAFWMGVASGAMGAYVLAPLFRWLFSLLDDWIFTPALQRSKWFRNLRADYLRQLRKGGER